MCGKKYLFKLLAVSVLLSAISFYPLQQISAKDLTDGCLINPESEKMRMESSETSSEMLVDPTPNESKKEDLSIMKIIVPSTETNLRTYHFYNGKVLLDTQVLKNGDTLIEPAVPEKENQIFTKWITEDGQTFSAFGTVNDIPAAPPSNNETVNIYAQFEESLFVRFHDIYGNVAHTETVRSGDTVSTKDVSIELPPDNYISTWTRDPNQSSENLVGNTITIEHESIDLYPVIKGVTWIFFHGNDENDSSKANIVNPVFVKEGETVSEPSVTRTGYTFGGWYTNREGSGSPYDFTVSPSATLNLYAKWIPEQVKYNIIIWKESLVDGKYVAGNYVQSDSFTLAGEAGSKIVTADVNTKVEAFISEKINAHGRAFEDSYYHFDFNRAKTENTNQNIIIDGNGSTTLNYYYDLHPYTVNYNVYGGPWNGITEKEFDAYMNIRGERLSSYSFIYHAGEISKTTDPFELYPNVEITPKDSSNQKKFAGWVIKQVSGGTIYNFILFSKKNSQISAHFLLKDVPGINSIDSASSGGFIPSEKIGFVLIGKPEGYPDSDPANFTYYFYYKRLKYTLSFYNNGAIEKIYPDIKYEAPIQEKFYIPKKPSGLSDDYDFKGWVDSNGKMFARYKDGNFSCTGESIMPARNIMLYAKWDIKQINVNFDSNGGTKLEPQTINCGTGAIKPKDPQKEGYVFGGWVNAKGNPFNFSTKLRNDTTLYARWITTKYIRIAYDAKEGSDAPIDDHTYLDVSSVQVLNAPELVPYGKYFAGWQLREKIYLPNENMMLKSEYAILQSDGTPLITLEAVYRDAERDTSLLLFANNGSGDIKEIPLKNNSRLSIPTIFSLRFKKYGYLFAGWNTRSNGSGKTYRNGEQIVVDNKEPLPNALYAMWIPDPDKAVPHTGENGSWTQTEAIVLILSGLFAMFLLVDGKNAKC